MKNIRTRIYKINITVLTCIAFVFSACVDYLDPYPNGDRSEEDIWKYPDMAQGLVGQAYDHITQNYDDNEGAFLDCATDNAISTNTTRDVRNAAVGVWTTSNNFLRSYWQSDYQAIGSVNRFLEDRKGFNTKYLVKADLDSVLRYRLQGEAFGLRAWFYFDLLQKFGGKGDDGRLLGVPLITKVYEDITQEIDEPRATYDETVQQILSDLDSAYKYLPKAYRDFLIPSKFHSIIGSRSWGRIDGMITRAIKANVYLTWASPAFNPGNDLTRYDSAAKYAKIVMDFKMTDTNPSSGKGFNWRQGVNWFQPNFPSFVWASRYGTNNDAMEKLFYPGGFQGYGAMGPTQELVDAFPMANGYPITDPQSGYDPNNPYEGRDPRFYSTIFYNGAEAKRNNNGAVMYTFDTYQGGKDAPYASQQNTLTGYYIKKFVYMGLNWSDSNPSRQRHNKALIRWAHMVLAFAEAANEVEGPNGTKHGLSAKEAMRYLRARKDEVTGQPIFETDPYLDEVASNPDSFREFIRNERRIITCFEGIRYHDMRRWGLNLNSPVHGIQIIKNGDELIYEKKEVEKRIFPSPYSPIPFEEILRMPSLSQNQGWESWN